MREEQISTVMSISVSFPYKVVCEIEDYCQRNGIHFDKYFLSLHEKNYERFIKNIPEVSCIEKISETNLDEVKDQKEYPEIPSEVPEKGKRGRPFKNK